MELGVGMVSRCFELDSCESDGLSCVNCATLKLHFQVLTNELKSAQQIIKILHEDRIKIISNLENRYNSLQQTYANAVVNKMKKPKGINLSDSNTANKTKNIIFPNVKVGGEQKIVILGDSHVKGLAAELKRSLNDEFESLGIAKPGSSLVNSVKSHFSGLKTLKKSDVCVVWGGTNDVGKNKTYAGVQALNDLVKSLSRTTVIAINVPHRHDLSPNSCVNNEVKVFNRKVEKLGKAYENLSVLPVDFDRDLFTRHGLHLNTKWEGTHSTESCFND
jgi:hypothetical protein